METNLRFQELALFTCFIFCLLTMNSGRAQTNVESLVNTAYAAYVAGTGPNNVTIPSGTYQLTALPSPNATWHLYFTNMNPTNQFTINAQGAVFYCITPASRSIAFYNCSNVRWNGGTFIRGTIPTSQGTIQDIAPNYTYVDIAVSAGYPTIPTGTSTFVINIFDTISQQLEPNVPDLYVNRVTAEPQLGNNVFRFTTNSLTSSMPVAVGDFAAWRSAVLPDFNLRVCQNMIIDGVTIKGGAGFCFSEQGGNGGNHYSNCIITYPPLPSGASQSPLLASNADGFHSSCVRSGPILLNCSFEGLDDDGYTVHGNYGLIAGTASGTPPGTTVTVNYPSPFGNLPFGEVGDNLNFYNTYGTYEGAATINSITLESGTTYQVTLNQAMPAVTTNWQVADTNMLGSGFQITQCSTQNQRAHGMFIESTGGLIQDCTVANTVSGGIVLAPELSGSFHQSDYANNIQIIGNRISAVGIGREDWTGALTIDSYNFNEFTPLPAGHKNVTVSNNIFENNNGVNILVSSSDHTNITDNTFINPMQQTVYSGNNIGVDQGALIWATESTNLSLSGNIVANPGTYMTHAFEATSSASGTGFTTGVVTNNAITALFNGGNSSSKVDAYVGEAGNGWLGAWGNSMGAATATATVTATSPLESWAGNYLATTITTMLTGGGGALYRYFDGSTAGVNVTQPHEFMFDVRPDAVPTGARFVIFDENGGASGGSSASSTWIIQGTTSGWQVFNGNGAGSGSYVTNSTFTSLSAGAVYRFVVNVNPAAKTWTVTISNGNTSYTSPTLGFCAATTSDGQYLEFGAQNIGTSNSLSLPFSIDNISIIATP